MNKTEPKNKKLLNQIGVVTVVYATLFLLLMNVILYTSSVQIYLNAKEEQLTETLERLRQKLLDPENYTLNTINLDYYEKLGRSTDIRPSCPSLPVRRNERRRSSSMI